MPTNRGAYRPRRRREMGKCSESSRHNRRGNRTCQKLSCGLLVWCLDSLAVTLMLASDAVYAANRLGSPPCSKVGFLLSCGRRSGGGRGREVGFRGCLTASRGVGKIGGMRGEIGSLWKRYWGSRSLWGSSGPRNRVNRRDV